MSTFHGPVSPTNYENAPSMRPPDASTEQPLISPKMNVGRDEKPVRNDKSQSRGCASAAARQVETAIPKCFFLRRRFFATMALILLSFIATMEALNASSNHNNGFVTAIASQALLWQYGPVFGKLMP